MRQDIIRFVAVLVLAASGTTSGAPIKDDGTWRPIFFREIDHVAASAKLEPLRDKKLREDETEVRVWEGFGLRPLKGYVLYRSKTSKAWFIKDGAGVWPVTPKSGWESLWKTLETLRVYSLPDSKNLSGEVPVRDGTSFVVEIRSGKAYRNYCYGNPNYQPWPEAKSMLSIARLLREQLEP